MQILKYSNSGSRIATQELKNNSDFAKMKLIFDVPVNLISCNSTILK